jgi:ABC-type Na+ transport system ATPase subunit NatA
MPVEHRPSRAQISAQIRLVARRSAVFFSNHAMTEMAHDGLDLSDMLAVMKGCHVVEEQPGAKYKVEGHTSDGILVVAVCQLQETSTAARRVFVITVWKVIKR